MIARLLLVCCFLILLATGLFALAVPEPRADFAYLNPSGIHTLDPARMSWTQDLRVAINIWEGLASYHPKTTEPIEGAATVPPDVSDDRMTYVFTIRDDARWSNGDVVTADDFIRGWRRVMEPGTGTDYAFLFTDYVAGAAEYSRWRYDAVAVLAPLSRLAQGWGIDDTQAKTILDHATVRRELVSGGGLSVGRVPWASASLPVRDAIVARANKFAHGTPPSPIHRITHDGTPGQNTYEQADDAGSAAARIDALDVDWAAIHEAVFDEHLTDLDEQFSHVGVEARGEKTLVVRLTRPCPYFPDLTAFPTLMPCHESIERLRERHRGAPITAEGLVVYDPQWTKPDYHRNGYPGLITNGPYALSDWTFKRRVRLSVNPYHRAAGSIACRTVDMVVYENVSTAIMAYEAGALDFLPSMDVPYDHEIARLAASGERPDFHRCVTLATYFFNFNCVSAEVQGRSNPFRDALLRKALALAVDKDAIVNRVLQRGDRIARTFVPPDAIAGYTPPDGLTHDPDEARRLLAEAGFPGGVGLPPIEILYTPRDERVCQVVAAMWQRTLGLKVQLRGKESKTFGEDKANHRFMIARGNWYADYGDPTTFLDCLSTGNGNNDSGYSNDEYDRLLKEAAAATDPAGRMALLRKAEAIIVEQDLPILPILHYATPIAISPNVRGLYPNARLIFPFRYVEVER